MSDLCGEIIFHKFADLVDTNKNQRDINNFYIFLNFHIALLIMEWENEKDLDKEREDRFTLYFSTYVDLIREYDEANDLQVDIFSKRTENTNMLRILYNVVKSKVC